MYPVPERELTSTENRRKRLVECLKVLNDDLLSGIKNETQIK